LPRVRAVHDGKVRPFDADEIDQAWNWIGGE
jgi:hypothetical protein